jgi:hypothetical protein
MSGKRNGRPVFAISAKSRQIRPSDPRAGILILPANENEPWAKGTCAAGQGNQTGGHSSLTYIRLIVSRCSQGLLEPFGCVVCGAMALDPIGWNGPHQPLCEFCADPTGGPA